LLKSYLRKENKMSRYKEEYTYVKMRRNVRKTVLLKFKHYELRVKADIVIANQKPFESILPLIKIKNLRRYFIKEEILFELKKIKGCKEADLMIEVFAVYGVETSIGEYKRYLGELDFFMSGVDTYEQATYSYKKSFAYFQQPEKSSFIPERL